MNFRWSGAARAAPSGPISTTVSVWHEQAASLPAMVVAATGTGLMAPPPAGPAQRAGDRPGREGQDEREQAPDLRHAQRHHRLGYRRYRWSLFPPPPGV